MKEDIKNVQSLQVNLEGEYFVFNRFGNIFVFNEDNKVETVDGSFSSNRNIQLSEDSVKNLDYTVLTYTDEYKQKLEDEYEATLHKQVNTDDPTLWECNKNKSKKRVRKYNQIARKLDEYNTKLFVTKANSVLEPEDKEAVTVYTNMIKLLEWVLKIK